MVKFILSACVIYKSDIGNVEILSVSWSFFKFIKFLNSGIVTYRNIQVTIQLMLKIYCNKYVHAASPWI